MNINLNVSDLMILLILAFGKLVWLGTYAWYGGEILCKLFNYITILSFYISSNIVVCIALDRLRNVLSANRLKRGPATVCLYIVENVILSFDKSIDSTG
jgi:hypothetical protein